MFHKIRLRKCERNRSDNGYRVVIGAEFVNLADAKYTMKHENLSGDFTLLRHDKEIFVTYYVFDDEMYYADIYFEMIKCEQQILNELAEPLKAQRVNQRMKVVKTIQI